MPSKIILDEKQIEIIGNDFYSGMTIKEMAKKNHMSDMTLRPILKSLQLKRFGRISQSDIDKVNSLKQYHISKISDITGFDSVTIRKISEKYNIKLGARPKRKIIIRKKSRYDILKESFTISELRDLLSISIHHACIKTGFTEGLIKRYAMEFNISCSKNFVTTTDIGDEQKLQIRQKYMEGIFTNKDICKMFGIGSRVFRNITHDLARPDKIINEEYESYRYLCRRITEVVKNAFEISIPAGHHLDHKISIYDGYKQNIPPYLIASMENLELLPLKDNLIKGKSSSITKDDLYTLLKI